MSTRKSAKKNSNLYYIIGAVAALVVAGGLIAFSLMGGDGSDKVADEETITAIQENVAGIPASGTVLGDPKAPVTIRDFSDVACIHCRTAAVDHLPQVVTDLVRTGKAKIELVPVSFISATSERGALGILAAADQDAAWPFAETLFHIQGNAATDWLSDDDMRTVAEQLGLDVAAWDKSYASSDIEKRYFDLRDAVQEAGVTSTPTFVITGPGGTERVEGAQTAAVITAAVDKVSSAS